MFKKIILVSVLLSISSMAFAGGDRSWGFIQNDSNYTLVKRSDWAAIDGGVFFNRAEPYITPLSPVIKVVGVAPVCGWGGYHGLYFGQCEDSATAMYAYYDSENNYKGECIFSFATISWAFAPSFADSGCTGPIKLETVHSGGGTYDNDNYTYHLSN